MSKDKSASVKGNFSKEDYTKIKIIFDFLETDPQAYDFLEPVDFVGKIHS